MTHGLSPYGFDRKRLITIKTELEEALQETFGSEINLEPDSVLATVVGITSMHLAEVWELAEAVYHAQYPDSATGADLDRSVALVGLARFATPILATNVLLLGDAGAIVPADSQVSAQDTGTEYVSEEAAKLGAASYDAVTARFLGPNLLVRYELQVSWQGSPLPPVIHASPLDATPADTASAMAASAESQYGDLVVIADTSDEITLVATVEGAPLTVALNATLPLLSAVSPVLHDHHTYTVTINGTAFSTTAGSPADAGAIVDGLVAEINAGAEPVHALVGGGGDQLIVIANPSTTPFDLVVGANFVYVADPGYGTTEVEHVPIAAATTTMLPVDAASASPANAQKAGIDTPAPGWRGAYIQGAIVEEETDTALRRRRYLALRAPGASVAEAIRQRILEDVDGVQSVVVLEYTGQPADPPAVPPHSFELVVEGGDEQAIADRIWQVKPAGIRPVSTNPTGPFRVSRDVLDSMGVAHLIEFSRPEPLYVWLRVTITKHPEQPFPTDGAAQVATRLAAVGAELGLGQDLVISRFVGAAHLVPGVYVATVERATGAASGPGPPSGDFTTANLAVGFRQRAEVSEDRISVAVEGV